VHTGSMTPVEIEEEIEIEAVVMAELKEKV
jgi:hypothetical protein